MSNQSPKGKYRMWHVGLIAFLFLGLSASQSGQSDHIWLWEVVHTIGRAGGAITGLYYASRTLVHTRSHEITDQDEKYKRDNFLIIAVALVLCGVFAGS